MYYDNHLHMKLRTGDNVVVITGKDKGKTGKILRVLSHKNHVVVESVNMRTKHIRKTSQNAGQKIRYEASLDASNVMFVDLKTKKWTRLGFRIKDDKKVRVCKKSGEVIQSGNEGKEEKKKEKKTSDQNIDKGKAKGTTKHPTKKPFWHRLGLGADALAEIEEKEPSHMREDHSVPEDGKLQSPRSHQRGS
jgi:large subunit ribosomal protein L24